MDDLDAMFEEAAKDSGIAHWGDELDHDDVRDEAAAFLAGWVFSRLRHEGHEGMVLKDLVLKAGLWVTGWRFKMRKSRR